jgi:mannosyltransferase OCH1-like enzyme
MIPRIFHQIWIGTDPFPAEFAEYQETWRQNHPEWELRFWTEDNLPADLRFPEVYDRERVPAERSDIIRLDLLWRFGGVYVDTDFECRRSISKLLTDDVDFFTAYLKPGAPGVNNAIFGAAPRHPILEQGLREVRLQDKDQPFDKTASGRLFFERIVQENADKVRFLPAEKFYPDDATQRKKAYCIHHCARSWKDAAGWRQAALRAEERLDKERRVHQKTRRALTDLKEEVTVLKARLKQAEKQEVALLKARISQAETDKQEVALLKARVRQAEASEHAAERDVG